MFDATATAWKLTLNPAGRRAFPDSPIVQWVVKYPDGSGNLVDADGSLMYVDGTPFEHEPSSHLDPTWSDIEAVHPSTVPSPR